MEWFRPVILNVIIAHPSTVFTRYLLLMRHNIPCFKDIFVIIGNNWQILSIWSVTILYVEGVSECINKSIQNFTFLLHLSIHLIWKET